MLARWISVVTSVQFLEPIFNVYSTLVTEKNRDSAIILSLFNTIVEHLPEEVRRLWFIERGLDKDLHFLTPETKETNEFTCFVYKTIYELLTSQNSEASGNTLTSKPHIDLQEVYQILANIDPYLLNVSVTGDVPAWVNIVRLSLISKIHTHRSQITSKIW